MFLDCQREISFGLVERTPNDHTGGIIRNNIVRRNFGQGIQINGDVGLNPGSAQGIPPSQVNGTIHVTDQTIIDAQAEYRDGAVKLPGIDQALKRIAALLARLGGFFSTRRDVTRSSRGDSP